MRERPQTRDDDPVCYEWFLAWFLLLEAQGASLMSTAADLKTSLDALTAAVAKVSAEVAALKAAPPIPQNLEQADLDAAVASVSAAAGTLNAL